MEVARSRFWAPDGREEDQVGVCFLHWFSKPLPCFRLKTVIFHTRFQTLPLKSIFNFERKDQLTKKKYRILIKDLISNKWKNKTKEATLILQSGKYISLPTFWKARPSFFRVLHTMIKVKLNCCVASVKRGRGNLGAQGTREGKERNPSLLLPSARSRALIPLPFECPATQARFS